MPNVIELDTFQNERYGNALASQIHVFDIDILLTTIVYQRYPGTLNFLGRRRPSFLEDYAIEGRVEEARHPENGSSLLIYLSGYDDPNLDELRDDLDPRSPCYIATDRRDAHSWSSRMYVRNALFRRLVELHATKRIDAVKLSVRLNMTHAALDAPFGSLKLPFLEAPSHPYFRHARCQLLSVYTSLAAEAGGAPAGQANIRFRLPVCLSCSNRNGAGSASLAAPDARLPPARAQDRGGVSVHPLIFCGRVFPRPRPARSRHEPLSPSCGADCERWSSRFPGSRRRPR
jgi:hypothetical protein